MLHVLWSARGVGGQQAMNELFVSTQVAMNKLRLQWPEPHPSDPPLDTREQLMALVDRCWAEDAADRPTMAVRRHANPRPPVLPWASVFARGGRRPRWAGMNTHMIITSAGRERVALGCLG